MKRYIVASEYSSEITPQAIKKILNAHGIDTTAHNYEMKAQAYERYESGNIYTLRFRANGDWIAYLAMDFHKRPSADNINDWFYYGEFKDLVDNNPTVEAIKAYASAHWYGDGSDSIIYLKNTDTDQILYESDDYSYPEEYEDMDEEEGW